MQSQLVPSHDVIVLGGKGFLGSMAAAILRSQGHKVTCLHHRLREVNEIAEQIRRSNAKFVLCAAGISGRPTIAWCEKNEEETFHTNMLDTCNLMRMCKELCVHLTLFGSGLVYKPQSQFFQMYDENAEPDHKDRVYCRYRVMLEEVVRRNYADAVLYLRIMYPCSFDGHPKCFVRKMLERLDAVDDVMVPVTVIPALFPFLERLMFEKRKTGVLNFVCRGVVALPELVKAHVRPEDAHKIVVNPPVSPGFGLVTRQLEKTLGEPPDFPKASDLLSPRVPRFAGVHGV